VILPIVAGGMNFHRLLPSVFDKPLIGMGYCSAKSRLAEDQIGKVRGKKSAGRIVKRAVARPQVFFRRKGG
jgi:hypothetical protein